MKLKDPCSLKEKLWPWKKSILKSIDITLPTEIHIVKVMVFPVVIYWYESWTIKKTKNLRIDTFELWCWRRLLRVLWTARRSNQSILREINAEYSLERLMLKLELQYFSHLMKSSDPLEKTRMLGKIGGRRRRSDRGWDGWMASMSKWTWVGANSRRWWRIGKPDVLQFMVPRRVGHGLVTEQQQAGCLRFNSILKLSLWRWNQIP